MLRVAYDEAVAGLAEGGIPIGAALFTARRATLLGRGHNRRVQEGDASIHAETDAFRKAGRRRDYPDCVMVTTLSPCWYCSGLVRQFNIGAVVIGEAENFHGGHDWLAELGVEIVVLDDPGCMASSRRSSPSTPSSGTRTSGSSQRTGGPKRRSPASPRPGRDVADVVELLVERGRDDRARRGGATTPGRRRGARRSGTAP